MKREYSPLRIPYKRKAKGKEIKTGFHKKPSKTARACARVKQEFHYAEAGAAADELINILGGDPLLDRGTWAWYCYHHDIGVILDKAHEIASRHRQGELQDRVTAFQSWLQQSFKEACL